MKELVWEGLVPRNSPEQPREVGFYGVRQVRRAKVPGGWLVATFMDQIGHVETYKSLGSGGVTFYPDPNHTWNGASLS
jgi:hypothetical protein